MIFHVNEEGAKEKREVSSPERASMNLLRGHMAGSMKPCRPRVQSVFDKR